MHMVGTHWLIDNEEEFEYECSFSFKTLEYVDKIIEKDDVRWWFDRCYANWEDEVHFVLFTSYITEEYKDYVLSIKVTKEPTGQYDFSIQKKVP